MFDRNILNYVKKALYLYFPGKKIENKSVRKLKRRELYRFGNSTFELPHHGAIARIYVSNNRYAIERQLFFIHSFYYHCLIPFWIFFRLHKIFRMKYGTPARVFDNAWKGSNLNCFFDWNIIERPKVKHSPVKGQQLLMEVETKCRNWFQKIFL